MVLTEPGRVGDYDLSIVIPVYNEEDTLPELRRRIVELLPALGVSTEVILVNDGSHDQTEALLTQLVMADNRFKALHFSRNFGHQAAITAGVNHASGKAVAVMDADLQDPPDLLIAMLEKWHDGFEIVYAQRRLRAQEGPLKRGLAYAFYRLLSRLSEVRVPEDTGDFCLMDRKVVDHLNALPERNRYMRGLRAWLGYSQAAVLFDRPARHAGEPKYTFAKSLGLALDAMIGFSKVPLRLASYLGLMVSSCSFGLGLFFIWQRLSGADVVRGWASTIVVVLFLGGVQLLTIGIIGEYLIRIYDEVKQRPSYVVRRLDGFPPALVA